MQDMKVGRWRAVGKDKDVWLKHKRYYKIILRDVQQRAKETSFASNSLLGFGVVTKHIGLEM